VNVNCQAVLPGAPPKGGETETSVEQRIVRFVAKANWGVLAAASLLGLLVSTGFFLGVLAGGLIACGNFHLLARTLKGTFASGRPFNYHIIIAKYYLRFVVSGFLIFSLIIGGFVNPLGLLAGLSVVVASIIMALVPELKHHLG
jgi:hypothetical protein